MQKIVLHIIFLLASSIVLRAQEEIDNPFSRGFNLEHVSPKNAIPAYDKLEDKAWLEAQRQLALTNDSVLLLQKNYWVLSNYGWFGADSLNFIHANSEEKNLAYTYGVRAYLTERHSFRESFWMDSLGNFTYWKAYDCGVGIPQRRILAFTLADNIVSVTYFIKPYFSEQETIETIFYDVVKWNEEEIILTLNED